MYRIHKIIAATSIVVALTATGCAGCSVIDGGTHAGDTGTGAGTGSGAGNGNGAGTPGARGSSPGPAVYHQAAECIRAHGAPNFPDPTQNPQTGRWDLPPGTRKPPQSVMNACRSILSQIPETKEEPSPRPLTAAEMNKARQFAQCMRRHGLADFPDPDANGDFPVPQRYVRLGKTGIRAQLEACQKYNVRGTHLIVQGGP